MQRVATPEVRTFWPLLLGLFGAAAGADAEVKAELLWPLHINFLPLSGREGHALEPESLADELTHIAESKFQEYLGSTLLLEAQVDQRFAEEYNASDHSRQNLAFRRWQTRAFAETFGYDVSDLTGVGQRIPKLQGINYTWPEFYGSLAYGTLVKRITQVSRMYLKRTGYQEIPRQFRIFIWAEIFFAGDALRPRTEANGAYVAGRYFTAYDRGSMKVNFEDPRGINPPFGKTHSIEPEEGMLLLFPSWLSQFLTPNMKSETQVIFSFLAFSPDGQRLRWKDDLTSSLIIEQRPRGAAGG